MNLLNLIPTLLGIFAPSTEARAAEKSVVKRASVWGAVVSIAIIGSCLYMSKGDVNTFQQCVGSTFNATSEIKRAD